MTDRLVTICTVCQRPCDVDATHRGEPIHPWCKPDVGEEGARD